MTIENAVRDVLVAASTVTALVPPSRIKVGQGGDDQMLPKPYIRHRPVGLETTHTHDGGLMGARQWRFYQVTCVGKDYEEAKQVVEVIKAVLGAYRGPEFHSFLEGELPFDFDYQRKLQEIALDFYIYEALP